MLLADHLGAFEDSSIGMVSRQDVRSCCAVCCSRARVGGDYPLNHDFSMRETLAFRSHEEVALKAVAVQVER